MKHQKSAYFLLCDQMLSASISLPMEMLVTAEALFRSENKQHRLHTATVGCNRNLTQSLSGLQIRPDHTLNNVSDAALVVIPALWRNPRPTIQKFKSVIPWLIDLKDQGATIVAVGTGCCFLAEAGLLDDLPATTHWHYFDQFEKDYPKVDLKRQYFITRAQNIYCAASVNSVADLMVHFVREIYDQHTANHVQRNFFHEIRRPYEISAIYDDQALHHPDEDIVQAQIWLNDHYAEAINMNSLASDTGMSPRSFNRRFKDATGQTPSAYLQQTRIRNATELLKSTNLSIGDVAFQVGYGDKSHFTQLFKKIQNVTPSEYRSTVRAKLFTV